MARKRYRLLHLITRLDLGGAQQNTLYCMEHHDRERFDVALLAGRGGLLDDDARGLNDARVDLVPWLAHRIAPVPDVRAVFRLRSLLRSRRIDLLHTHSSKAGIVGRLAAVLAGVPAVVHTVHGWSFNPTQPPWTRRFYVALERIAASFSDRLVVVSARNRDEGVECGIGRAGQYSVIHSGIDVGEFVRPENSRDSVRRSLGLKPEHVLVGTIACLKPQKAPLDFVRAAATAHAEQPNLRFVIVGDGELMGEVSDLVRTLGLGDVVRLLGWRRDVVDLLHAMDVFLLTSLFEGLPRVVLQAMAAGVPVVATAVDGTPEVVEHRRTGLLVPPGDSGAAAAAVLEMARDGGLREGCIEAGRGVLSRRFDIHRMVRDLERIYLSHLEGHEDASGTRETWRDPGESRSSLGPC